MRGYFDISKPEKDARFSNITNLLQTNPLYTNPDDDLGQIQ